MTVLMNSTPTGPSRDHTRSSEEPGAGIPHAGICEGPSGNRQFYRNRVRRQL